MEKALEKLREYVERVDKDCLLNEESIIIQKQSLDGWKKQFKDFVFDVIKVIAEYSLFASDEEKYDCDNNKPRKEMAEKFIKENIYMIKDHGIEKLMKQYFEVYIPEKDEIYEEYLEKPLSKIGDSYDRRCLEDEVVYLIRDNLANIYAQYKNKLSGSKILKMISMHYKMDVKFSSMNSSFVTEDESKYILRMKEKNIMDMLEEYKKFVEGTEATEQLFINQLVYAQMILKQNFLKED